MGEELEREGMSRNWDRVEFTLVVDMWPGTRTEWNENADVFVEFSRRSKHCIAAGMSIFGYIRSVWCNVLTRTGSDGCS